jgi:hypothetical protein
MSIIVAEPFTVKGSAAHTEIFYEASKTIAAVVHKLKEKR